MLVSLRLTASALSCCIAVSAASQGTGVLQQSDLAKPDVVEAKLRAGVSAADKEMAKRFFAYGSKKLPFTDGTNNWGPILKAFGESAQFNPTPKNLSLYAEATLRSWREWSSVPKEKLQEAKRQALTEAAGIYDSALAANRVYRELNDSEVQTIGNHRDCIRTYLSKQKTDASCKPVVWIGIIHD